MNKRSLIPLGTSRNFSGNRVNQALAMWLCYASACWVNLPMGTGRLATLFRRCARLGVLSVILPGCVFSQGAKPKFQVIAVVFDPSGVAVPGATVQVESTSAAMEFRGPTNATGQFCIQLEAGKHTVSVTQSGFKPLTQQIEVTTVADQRFSFVLHIDSRYSGPCCFDPILFSGAKMATEMAKLSDDLVPPPFSVVPPLWMQTPATPQKSSEAAKQETPPPPPKRLFIEDYVIGGVVGSSQTTPTGSTTMAAATAGRNISLEATDGFMKNCPAVLVTNDRDAADYILRPNKGSSTLYKRNGDVVYVSHAKVKVSNLVKDVCAYVQGHP